MHYMRRSELLIGESLRKKKKNKRGIGDRRNDNFFEEVLHNFKEDLKGVWDHEVFIKKKMGEKWKIHSKKKENEERENCLSEVFE